MFHVELLIEPLSSNQARKKRIGLPLIVVKFGDKPGGRTLLNGKRLGVRQHGLGPGDQAIK